MSGGVPLGASARVESQGAQHESSGRPNQNRGGDFLPRVTRSDSSPVSAGDRAGRLALDRVAVELSARDLAILGLVGEFRLATGAQIQQLVFSPAEFATPATAARSGRRVLARLVRDRLLVRLARRVGGIHAGSAGHVYALGPVGYRVIGDSGRARPRYFEPSTPFAEHQLAVTQLAVELLLIERRGEIRKLDVQGEPRCWRFLPGQRARAGLLRPDLFVSLEVSTDELRWFVELDRGTAHVPAVLRKCRSYESYYRSGREQAEHGLFPRVLWITPGEERAERISREIEGQRELTAGLFGVTSAERALEVLCGAEDIR